MKTINQWVLFIGLLTAAVLSGCRTDGGTGTSQVGAPVGENVEPLADYLRVGDPLTLRLTGVPVEEEKLIEEKVDDDGFVSMPLAGRFKAAGKTTSQLRADIEKAYRDKRIYDTPNITIVTSQLRFVNVSGEVRIPQRVPFTNDLTVLRAITACGGFTDYADRRDIKLLRQNQVIVFDAVQALKNPSTDVPLRVGDQIQIPRSIF